MKPICVPCQRFFSSEKNGVYFIEGMPIGDKVPPGTAAPDQWLPYKLWVGDRWICKGCGATIISGVAQHALGEHYQSDFKDKVQRLNANFQVNDC